MMSLGVIFDNLELQEGEKSAILDSGARRKEVPIFRKSNIAHS
jgi:hypothetical protein